MLLLRATIRCFTVAVAILLTGMVLAQTRFNYQGVVRDANDTIVPNEPVSLRFTLHQDSETGLPVFVEEHLGLSTSSIGLVSVLIGGGTPGFGSLDSIPWSDHTYYLQVEVDIISSGFGFLEMGVSPIVSVPIAEYAKNGGKPWRTNANGIHYTEGYVGIGDSLPAEALTITPAILIKADTANPSETRIEMHATPTTGNYISSFNADDTRLWVMDMADRERDDAITFYSQVMDDNVLLLDPDGGLEVRANTHSKIRLYANSGLDNYISAYNSSGDQKWIINMGTSSPNSNEPFAIYSNEADGGNGQYLMYLRPDGRTQVRCLEILGGCDINERFNSTELLEPGTVVIADPDRPGEVRTTNEIYDARVLGVISGANGIKPGLTLAQENVLDGTHPLALSGRIFVKVTGPVKVGDMLTTSARPGRAMAVIERERAFGAVIGKALESDADGDGLVMMLVQPR